MVGVSSHTEVLWNFVAPLRWSPLPGRLLGLSRCCDLTACRSRAGREPWVAVPKGRSVFILEKSTTNPKTKEAL